MESPSLNPPPRKAVGGSLLVLGVAMVAVAVFAVQTGRASALEAVGFVAGALAVYLAAREHVLNWPVGLLTSASYAVFFFRGGLPADAYLQVVYFGLGLLGWHWWLRGDRGHELPITRASGRTWLGLAAAFVVLFTGFVVLGFRLNGSAPYLDALVTSGSLVGQYLLMRKHIENWLVWIVVDVIYVPLFLWKGWYLTSGLYVVYLVLAVMGMREWARLSGLRLVEAKVATVLLAAGAVVSAGIGWTCWRLERFFGAWLAGVRWSDSARVGGVTLSPSAFAHLKSEVCDPFAFRPAGPERVGRGPGLKVEFLQAGKVSATCVVYMDGSAIAEGWQERALVKPWLKRLPKPR